MKVPLTRIYDDLNFASDRLSTQIRTLTFGVLALTWLFLSGSADVSALQVGTKDQLLWVAFFCVITLLIDAVQYWASYMSSNAVRNRTESKGEDQAEYDVTSCLWRLQHGSFWAKQVTAILATAGLLILLYRAIGSSS